MTKINILKIDRLLIDRDNIVMDTQNEICRGQFGPVFKGIYHSTEFDTSEHVAVKLFKKRDELAESFIDDALVMKEFIHDHVMTLIGITFDENGLPLIVMPYMQNSDLLDYLRQPTNSPTVENLITFVLNIVQGLAYLSGMNFVHHDLAARNIMINSSLFVKIGDYGQSRYKYPDHYYSLYDTEPKLPVKWMAPESLEREPPVYDIKTNSYTYGIVIWEVMSRGLVPYGDVPEVDLLMYVKSGRRMDRPECCPNELYDIMIRCWYLGPDTRPEFSQLVDEIGQIHSNDQINHLQLDYVK